MGPLKSSRRLVSSRWEPGLCVVGGMTRISDPFCWLSHVCEVITDPSTEAFLPTMIEVHAGAARPRGARNKPSDRKAKAIGRLRMGFSLGCCRRREEKGDRPNLPERSEGGFAQIGPVPFFLGCCRCRRMPPMA